VQGKQTGETSPLGLGDEAKGKQHQMLEVKQIRLECLQKPLKRTLDIWVEEGVEEIGYGTGLVNIEGSTNPPHAESIAILPFFLENPAFTIVPIKDGYIMALGQRSRQILGVNLGATQAGGRKLMDD
jgi:hypothetical protein